jgi:hypothetical protein
MAYPRACVACNISFEAWSGSGSIPHDTVAAHDGGTPSPWRRGLPGRVLDLCCQACGAIFRWDYFGAGESRRLGRAIGLVRGPMRDLEDGGSAPRGGQAWRGRDRQRAS